jgi:ATP-binding cassette subfamily F protein 3
MLALDLRKINKFYGSFQVLKDITLTLPANEIVGLIGVNGAGKSTLCNIIAGDDTEFDGEKNIYPGIIPSYFRQMSDSTLSITDSLSVFEYILQSQDHVLKLEQRYHDLLKALTTSPNDEKLLKEFGNVQDEYLATEAYNLLERIEETLNGLGIKEHGDGARNISWHSQIAQLSGGERKIVELAVILLNKKANLLILDEPTNHLDIEGREWLETFIRGFRGTVIIVSHDRYLLNRLSQTIWEIEAGRLIKYTGNYDQFEVIKKREHEALVHKYEMQQKELSRLEEVLKELRRKVDIGGSPKIVSQYNAMKTRIEKYKEECIPNPDNKRPEMILRLREPPKMGHISVRLSEVNFEFSDSRKIFENTSTLIHNGERIALLGANGTGKSTLMKLILSRYVLDREINPKEFGVDEFVSRFSEQIKQADIYIGPSVKIAYYSQNHSFVSGQITLRELLKQRGVNDEGAFQSIIRQFQFSKDTVDDKYLSELSGGEKSKVQFMLLSQSEANVLLLDEPINHLDIASMKIVEEVLAKFTGTIIVISHDRYFLNRIINKVIYIKDHTMKEFLGTYDEYLTWKASKVA